MSDADRQERTASGRGTLWGVPGWAWGAGLAIGAVIGMMLFDDLIVSLMFGASIGTVFAMAFAGGARERDGDARDR